MIAFNTGSSFDQEHFNLVIGGGNAALCAAMTAREAGADVLLLECAPQALRAATAGTPGICGIFTKAETIF